MSYCAALGRTVSALAVVAAGFILGACNSQPQPMSVDELFRVIKQESGPDGGVDAQQILVTHEDGNTKDTTVYIVHRPDGSKVLIDLTGQRYEPSLDDFLANNHLFSPKDKLSLPREFPDNSPGAPVDLITVPGHTTPSTQWVWWLAGGAVLSVAVAATFFWLQSRRPPGSPKSGIPES